MGRKSENKHPKAGDLRQMLRALSVPDAGYLLHLLDCPRCAQLARKELAPKPIRRRKPKAPATGEVKPA
jgi:hypothetical protein